MKMLVKFSVENFLSFDEQQTLSMETGKVRQKMEHVLRDRRGNILKFAAIYGANAAGKSALVNAMMFSQQLIMGSTPYNIASYYCKIREQNRERPSTFEYHIKIESKTYIYGFSIQLFSNQFQKEWLRVIENNTCRDVYCWEPESGKLIVSETMNKKSRSELQFIAKNMTGTDAQLFITEMNRNKGGFYENNKSLEYFRTIFNWFTHRLIINYPDTPISSALFVDPKKLDEANKIFRDMDLGFSELKLVPGSMDDMRKALPHPLMEKISEDLIKKAMEQKKKGEEIKSGALLRGQDEFFILNVLSETMEIKVEKFITIHNNCKETFDLSSESDGTRRIIDLIEIIVSAKIGRNRVYVIDEINRCLHPLLTHRLIELFLTSIEGKEIQLIVTTHESYLLKTDLLRHDEIRFVTKKKDGSSVLTPMGEHNERVDKRLINAYLDGKYEGIPVFSKPKEERTDDIQRGDA